MEIQSSNMFLEDRKTLIEARLTEDGILDVATCLRQTTPDNMETFYIHCLLVKDAIFTSYYVTRSFYEPIGFDLGRADSVKIAYYKSYREANKDYHRIMYEKANAGYPVINSILFAHPAKKIKEISTKGLFYPWIEYLKSNRRENGIPDRGFGMEIRGFNWQSDKDLIHEIRSANPSKGSLREALLTQHLPKYQEGWISHLAQQHPRVTQADKALLALSIASNPRPTPN